MMLDKDKTRRVGRRSLIQWSLAAGAALGLPQWKVLEALEVGAGKAVAQEAACRVSNRSVHIVAGGGGFAWFQLLWPHVDIAEARNENFAWHAIGEDRRVAGTDKPLVIGPESPWSSLSSDRQVSCFMAGTNQTHTRRPASTTNLAMGSNLFAACAAIQTGDASVVPHVAIGNVQYGVAEGAPRTARVESAGGMVGLFNSAASRAGGLLDNRSNQALFASRYNTWMSLRAASGRAAFRSGVGVGAASARLIGENLADALRPTEADRRRYGFGADSYDRVRDLGDGLIVAAKSFALGLTNSVVLPAMYDDPHGAFNNMGRLRTITTHLGAMLQAFYDDLAMTQEPDCVGESMADNLVISIHGDTPKNPRDRSGWPDGTPSNSNWVYVYSSGMLKSGWFGGVDRAGNVAGWDPGTGEDVPGRSSCSTSSAAAAAIAYSVCKGDLRRLQDFYRGESIRGVVASDTV